MINIPSEPQINRAIPLALLVVAVGALSSAYTAQYAFGLEPCILCLYQRVPYAIVGLLGIVGYLVSGDAARRWVTALAALSFAIGAGLAFYHIGVEQHWWASAASCGGGDVSGAKVTVDQFKALLQQKPEKTCDEIDWTLFGISMAKYNAVASSGLAVIALVAWKRLGKTNERDQ